MDLIARIPLFAKLEELRKRPSGLAYSVAERVKRGSVLTVAAVNDPKR